MCNSFLLRKKYLGGRKVWVRGYFAYGTGNVMDEMIKSYIDNPIEGGWYIPYR